MFEDIEIRNMEKDATLSMIRLILSHHAQKRVPIEAFEDVAGWEVKRTFNSTPGTGWLVQFSVSRQAVAKCLKPETLKSFEQLLKEDRT